MDDLLLPFLFFCCGISFLGTAEDEKNNLNKIAGYLMLLASAISLMTHFFYN